jgi:hypothetical protein
VGLFLVFAFDSNIVGLAGAASIDKDVAAQVILVMIPLGLPKKKNSGQIMAEVYY